MSVAQLCQVNCFNVMGMKTLSILLIATSACWGLEIELKIQNDPQCKFKGQQCSADLRHIIYCSDKGGDSYVVATCEQGAVCNLNNQGEYMCRKKDVPNPPPDKPAGNNTLFTCQGSESYPDPYRCNTAYVCESVRAFPKFICECPQGSALVFSPGMTCTKNKDVKKDCMCPYKNRCEDGLGARDFGNCHPQFFYMCRYDQSGQIVADVYKCPPGEYYYEGKCQKPPAAVNLAEPSGKYPVCKEYHPPCFPEQNVKCSKKGELLPHGMIDRCYYFCGDNLTPVVKDCGVGSYFTCKYGQCGCVFGPKP